MPLSSSLSADHVLRTRDQAVQLAQDVRAAGIMGLDTEFVSERTYYPQLALLQVATPDAVFLIDPLAGDGVDQPIWEAMTDPAVRTVVHAYEQEARFCLDRTGRPPGDLFDVQLASAFCGYRYPIALASLLETELGQRAGPSQSRSDWLRRPLSRAQLRYAAEDVEWLLPLHDALSGRLRAADGGRRLRWLAAETQSRLDDLQAPRGDSRWRKLSGSGRLGRRSLAALEELHHWREAAAADDDQPVRQVAKDDQLVAVAASLPASVADLQNLRACGNLSRSAREPMLAAVRRALQRPESSLPQRSPQTREAKPSRVLTLFLETVLESACARHDINAGLVGGSSELRSVLRWCRNGRDRDDAPRLLQGWRSEVCGQDLLDAIDGRVALRIDDVRSDRPITVAAASSA